MKAKFIRMIIGRKVDNWRASIPDAALREAVKDHVIVTGGCITSMLLGEPVNDFDVYFDDAGIARRVAEHYVKRFKENPPPLFRDGKTSVDINVAPFNKDEPDRVRVVVKSAGVAGETATGQEAGYGYFEGDHDGGEEGGEAYVQAALGNTEALDDQPEEKLADKEEDKPRYRPRFLTSNAITLTDKVQLVLRFTGPPEQIHSNYDFVHCTNYWHSATRQLTLRQEALEATLARDLRYVGSKYPVCSLVRARKFIKRGWNINAGQLLKMAFQISKLDLSNLKVLEEQLVGVDAAYFAQLIDLLQEKDPVAVDANYLMTVIDRVF